jgi:curved DNA-binding protein CbpA
MKTLYELLGALPDDDAERLRAAFRKAAKANHPDNNPDDPDAPQRFRQVVRANAILSDERQRATYDRLLAIALQRQGSESERGISSGTIRKIAPDAIAIAILSVAFIGIYLLLGYMFKASLFSAQVTEVSRREPAQTAAAISTELSDIISRAGPRDKVEDVGAPNKPANPGTFRGGDTRRRYPCGQVRERSGHCQCPTARDFG